eukprot:TRINITY_DN10240_c0_g1_i1.p1 TRINITY_DN10240_c0_g1~~TRINITY_DN10240_c0_g1_i1.p1  ORF type:complete len:273 (-),score=53.25 TRINITY_DN10240_c0_g1_i1:342-1130(-)
MYFKVQVTFDQSDKKRMIECPRNNYSLDQVMQRLRDTTKNEEFSDFSIRWTRNTGAQQTIKQQNEFQMAVETALQNGEYFVPLTLHPIYTGRRPSAQASTPVRNTNTASPARTPVNTASPSRQPVNSPSRTFNKVAGQVAGSPSGNTSNRPSYQPVQQQKQVNGTLITSFILGANPNAGTDKVDIQPAKTGNVVVFTPVPSTVETEVSVVLESTTALNFVLEFDVTQNGQLGRMTLTKTFNVSGPLDPSMFTVDGMIVTLTM